MSVLQDLAPWVVDGLVVLSLFVMTMGVIGLAWLPDIYTKMHAASKAVFLGVVLIMLVSFGTRDASVIARGVLIIGALMITSPISSHVIANAAVHRNDRMRSPGAINESSFPLDKADSMHVGDSGDARLRTLFGE
ncbi:MAG: monovalent cation/H(+) antiporter subunit G [Thermomicrobiales bacterium]